MEGIEHKMVSVNGINMHIAEMGQGPLVLFLHGFPGLWYSWRHQLPYLAAHGYRAVAPDLRGYGDTTGAPSSIDSYTTLHVVGDIIGLLDVISPPEEKVLVVAHDWGAIVAWHLCLFRPDIVKALVNMSVPFLPRNPHISLLQSFRALYDDNHYIHRFQEPGDIEAEIERIGIRRIVKKFMTYREIVPWTFPKGEDGLGQTPDTPIVLPSWLSEEAADYYAIKFEQNGFTGPINWYRALDLTWELTAPWGGCRVKVPTKFMIGELDFVYHVPGFKEYIHGGAFHKDVPLLEEVVVIEGAAHFINQEKPDEINKHILDFIQKF